MSNRMEGPGDTDLLDQLHSLLPESRSILASVGTREVLGWDADALDTAFSWAEGIEAVADGAPANYQAAMAAGASLTILDEARTSRQRLAQKMVASGFLSQHPNAAELLQRLLTRFTGDLGGGRTVHAVMADVAASRAREAMALEAVHSVHQSLQGRVSAGGDGRPLAMRLRAYAKAVVDSAQHSPACPTFCDELQAMVRGHEHGAELLLYTLQEASARRKLQPPSAPLSPPSQADSLSILTDHILSWLASWEGGDRGVWEAGDEGLVLDLCEAYPPVAESYAAHLLTTYETQARAATMVGDEDQQGIIQTLRRVQWLKERSAGLRGLVEGMWESDEHMGRGRGEEEEVNSLDRPLE